VLLTVGDSDTTALKRRMEAAGLGKRAGFIGRRRDTAEFLKMTDVYLTPFGRPAAAGTLAAMTAGRPIIAMAGDGNDPQSPAALIGDEHVSRDPAAYAERVGRMIRDPQLRTKAGDANRQRAAERFSAEQTVRALESLCRSLLTPLIASHPQHAQAA
jgi:glycosyltransferase involved in cell wall biosynthesis